MIEAMRNLHGLGVPLEQALAAASTVPARVIGLPTLSRLDVDFPADVIVLDDNLELDRVFVGGQARVVA
jgi:N-acetylglucosamine-6-phosphate deacetylase